MADVRIGVGFEGGFSLFFRLVDFVGPWKVGQNGEMAFLCEGFHFFSFVRDVAAVEDQSSGLGVAAVTKVFDGTGDVASGVESHFFAAGDDEDVFSVAFADGSGEAPADDVAEDIVEDDVGLKGFKEAEIFKDAEGGDDATPGAAEAGRRTAGLDAENTAVAFAGDFGKALRRVVMFAEVVHDGLEGAATEKVRGGIGLGVASNLDDAFAEVSESSGEVAGDGGFSNATFAIDGNFLHIWSPLWVFL